MPNTLYSKTAIKKFTAMTAINKRIYMTKSASMPMYPVRTYNRVNANSNGAMNRNEKYTPLILDFIFTLSFHLRYIAHKS